MKRCLCGAVSTCLLTLFTTLAYAAVLPLESRLGGLAYYDPNLDMTWAANAEINGLNTWDNQAAWVASLNIGGITGWRLPSVDVNGDGTVLDCFPGGVPGCADNEMSYFYYEEGITSSTPGPFSNVGGFTWSGTESASDPGTAAWGFSFVSALQGTSNKGSNGNAWAVYSGDVGSVPIPAAAWLFGSGLLGLIGISRCRSKAS